MEKDKNTLVWIFIAVIVILFLIGSLGMGGYGMMGFGMGFGFIFMLIFWGVLIWLVVALINAGQAGRKEEDPSVILKKRYASGEISKKQYGEMKKELLP
ncbi:MAG TPA: SHOCT domain-containing protein [Candidatus Nanoarchaeia archaeon]|nr:SHOCT domain-containing protein [Candidatus Nanoarchaeia archaeon]